MGPTNEGVKNDKTKPAKPSAAERTVTAPGLEASTPIEPAVSALLDAGNAAVKGEGKRYTACLYSSDPRNGEVTPIKNYANVPVYASVEKSAIAKAVTLASQLAEFSRQFEQSRGTSVYYRVSLTSGKVTALVAGGSVEVV